MQSEKTANLTICIDLVDDPANPLRVAMDDDKLAELERDIRQNGLYYPLLVRRVGARYEVVDGHRRLVACRNIGLHELPCLVYGESSPPLEAVKLKSNLLREDNTDAEIAIWLGELVQKHGATLEALSKLVGHSEAWVNARTDLLRGDPAVLIALGERKINFSQAQALNHCKDARWRAMGLHYAIADNVPAWRLKEWLERTAPPIDVPPQAIAIAAPPNGGAGEQTAGIVCEFCGGWKDPHNMVNLWLHRWEWQMVQQILQMRQQEIEGQPPEPKD